MVIRYWTDILIKEAQELHSLSAWVGYPTSRLLSLMDNPGEWGPMVRVQPHILLAFFVNLNTFILQGEASLKKKREILGKIPN